MLNRERQLQWHEMHGASCSEQLVSEPSEAFVGGSS
jgi:hypothetical protein